MELKAHLQEFGALSQYLAPEKSDIFRRINFEYLLHFVFLLFEFLVSSLSRLISPYRFVVVVLFICVFDCACELNLFVFSPHQFFALLCSYSQPC